MQPLVPLHISPSPLQGGKRVQNPHQKSSAKVAIITIVFNGEKYLEKAICSIINQTNKDFEYIIIDGGSNDRSIEIIKKYESSIDYWISEKDKGISDAFNKGIQYSTAPFHTILNADDWFPETGIESAINNLKEGMVVLSGYSILTTESEEPLKQYTPKPELLTEKMSLPHNATFIHTPSFLKIGGYSLDKKIAMDHHIFMRLIREYGLKHFHTCNEHISFYRLGGISDNLVIQGFKEVRDKLYEHTNSTISSNYYFFKLFCKHHIVSILRKIRLK